MSNVSSSHLLLPFPFFHVPCSPSKPCARLLSQRLLSGTISLYRLYYVNEESPVSTFHITPSYIPSGFSQIESSGESTGRYYGQFQNSEGDWFSLRVLPVENSQVTSLDSEFSSYYSISFDNNQAIWGIMDDDSNTLLWESSTLSFQVRGNLSITELIKISEGIEIQ